MGTDTCTETETETVIARAPGGEPAGRYALLRAAAELSSGLR